MSTAETEKIIDDIKNVRNVANQHGKVVKPAVRYLRPHEKSSLVEENSAIQKVLDMPVWATQHLSRERRGAMHKRQIAIEEDLNQNSIPEISGPTQDAVLKLQHDLEARIKQGMIPTEVMRRNPVNAVDNHIRWEKDTKDLHLMWKKCKRLLNPESEDKDLANIETLRPSMLGAQESTFMVGSQIEGHMAYSGVPQENWDQTFGKPDVNSPLAQAEKREFEERISLLEAQVKKQEEIKAQRRDNMAKARAVRDKNKRQKEERDVQNQP